MRRRLAAAGLLGGVAVAAVLVVAVLKYGRYDPTPLSLEKHPNAAIPGELLFIDREGCLIRAAASGASRQQVYCSGQSPPFQVTWLTATTAAFTGGFSYPGSSWTEIDLATGRTSSGALTSTMPADGSVSPSGERAWTDGRELWTERDGQRTKIATFEAPEFRGPQIVTWSPDGEWLLLGYHPARGERQELWIISRDGRVQGALTESAQPWGATVASWWIDGHGFKPTYVEPRLPEKVVPGR